MMDPQHDEHCLERLRAQMAQYDELPGEVRKALANSCFGRQAQYAAEELALYRNPVGAPASVARKVREWDRLQIINDVEAVWGRKLTRRQP